MLQAFYPKERRKTVYELTPGMLLARGIRGIIFDIDNTLVPHGAPADDAIIAYFGALRAAGISACLLSNNGRERVESFASAVGAACIWKAGKPSRRGYELAMKKMGTNRSNTLFVGDQLFTDIWGANRSGLDSVLLEPIDPNEEIQIVLKRIPEKVLLFFYERRKKG